MIHEDAQTALPILAFGPFRLHRKPHLLCMPEEPVRLGGRAIDLLVALVERAGEVVSRAELERRVWPHTLVEDSCLRVHIAALRKALGDGIGDARYIANVPGRGYSFVAAVTVQSAGAAALAPGAPTDMRALPVRLGGIIGRDQALSVVRTNVTLRRLVSIVGHGGMGKTALAVFMARELEPDYADGACFIDLAAVSDPALLADALAAALGIAAFGGNVLLNLEQWLKRRRMLLLFDNCEHVLDAAAALIERVLRSAPGINILATSREPLDVEGEWVHRLQPLTFPDDDQISIADSMPYSALQLLADRASASSDSFALNQANLPAAIALCRRVDGVPLAIEFAAARVGLLGVQGVLAQLDDRLRLLGSGRRTVLPRHRTLRALLDWSYELLSPSEQRVLRCCSIFSGAFTLESAVAVIASTPVQAPQVRDNVLGLIAKSLIVAEPDVFHPSFSMLEITRTYAADRMGDDPECDIIAARHARQMVEVMRQCERDWDTTPRAVWLRYYMRLMGNVRAGLDWAFGPRGDPAIGVRLAAAMVLRLGRIIGEEQMRDHARHALKVVADGVAADPVDVMRLHTILAVTTGPDGNGPVLRAPLPACFVPVLQDNDDWESPDAGIEALYHFSVRCFAGGDYAAMRGSVKRSLALAEAYGNQSAVLHSQRMAAQALHFLGEHAAARAMAANVLAARSYALPLRIVSPVDRAVSMRIVQARALWMEGKGNAAAALAAECLEVASRDMTPLSLSQAISFCACPIALWRGDNDGAALLIERLAAHTDRNEMDYWSLWARQFRHVLAVRMGTTEGISGLPADPKMQDHLATFAPGLVTPEALARCEDGLVGWSAPEVLRLHGERRYRGGDVGGEAVLWRALGLASAQGAMAWRLRCATSIARMQAERGEQSAATALLGPVLASLGQEHDGADVRAAREVLERCMAS